MLRRVLLAGLVLLVGALLLAGCATTEESVSPDESESPPSEPVAEEPTEAPAGDTVGESTEPDTGRMSEGEYSSFQARNEEVVDESLQWTEGFQPCAVIGQTGDQAAFRECVQEAWDGTEGALLGAESYASDLVDDVAKGCRTSLRRYVRVLRNYYNRNVAAFEAANALDFEAMTLTFDRLPRASRRYVDAATGVLSACEPS